MIWDQMRLWLDSVEMKCDPIFRLVYGKNKLKYDTLKFSDVLRINCLPQGTVHTVERCPTFPIQTNQLENHQGTVQTVILQDAQILVKWPKLQFSICFENKDICSIP